MDLVWFVHPVNVDIVWLVHPVSMALVWLVHPVSMDLVWLVHPVSMDREMPYQTIPLSEIVTYRFPISLKHVASTMSIRRGHIVSCHGHTIVTS